MKLKKILFFIFFIFFFEIFFQFFYYIANQDYLFNRIELPIYQKSEIGCWKVKPNLEFSHKTDEFNYKIYTNKDSQRITKKETKKMESSNEKLVLFLGDYLTFGKGNNYDTTFAYLISKFYLAKKFNSINASVPAQLPNRQLCWFLEVGYKSKPDIIIQTINNNLNLNIPNNKNELINFCKKINDCKISNYTVENNKLVKKEKNFFSQNFLKNSATIYYFWKTLIHLRSERSKFADNKLKINLDIRFKKDYEESFQSYVNTIEYLSPKTKVIFLYIPKSYIVHPNDINRYFNKNFDNYSKEKNYNLSLAKYLETKFNFVNTFDELRLNNNERLYNYIDTSLNQKGNEVVFDAFLKYCKLKKC